MKSKLFLERVFASVFLISLFLPFAYELSPIGFIYKRFNEITIYAAMVLVPFLVYFVLLFFFKDRKPSKIIYIFSMVWAILFSFIWFLGVSDSFILICSIVLFAVGFIVYTHFSSLEHSVKTNNILIIGMFPTIAVFAFLNFDGFLHPDYGFFILNISFVGLLLFRFLNPFLKKEVV